ncbi:GntR family transcriptional regulator [Neotabrizicola sp. VNH66]|uniref:GntR family transcriptional regulator n=1 Tax=Neotabrizicola sp. VNH66 TaxID=3400918 RepID=UPI003C07D215
MQEIVQSQPEPGKTRTAEILDVLRDEILEARLVPGEKLRFDELRETYDIGISPLREALMHLASEGLVTTEQRKGYRVAPVSGTDLREIAFLRGEFDAMAIRHSIANGDELWEGRVLAAFHAMQRRKKIGPDGDVDREWERHHIRFHSELVSECRMPKLLSFRTILDLQAQRYRRIAAAHYLNAPRDDVIEHMELRDAVLNRDADLAGQLVRAHYSRTVDIILAGEIAVDPADPAD